MYTEALRGIYVVGMLSVVQWLRSNTITEFYKNMFRGQDYECNIIFQSSVLESVEDSWGKFFPISLQPV